MARIRFAKMQGIGNDFVVVDSSALRECSAAQLAKFLCARNFSIGSDGLLIVGRSEQPDIAFTFRMHNPDGSPDMCGNGLRCGSLYAFRNLGAPANAPLVVDTIDGRLQASLIDIADDRRSASALIEMTAPRLSADQIPFSGKERPGGVIDYPLEVAGETLSITALYTGSTHSIAFVDALPEDDRFLRVSPLVETHPDFPQRTSLIWAKATGDGTFDTRIWERAVGETLGCGTGACAVAAAAVLTGRASFGQEIAVRSKGGTLCMIWHHAEGPVWMRGPAQWVFDGEIEV